VNVKDYSKDIETLEKLYESLQQNVYFSIGTIIAILSVALVIAGWALSVLAKSWVNKRVDAELNIIDDRIRKIIKENPTIYYATGTVSSSNGEIVVTGLKDFNSRYILSIEVWDQNGLHLEKVINHNDLGYLSIKCPQLSSNNTVVHWAVTWIPKTTFIQN
jgi:hypothetical protein